MHRKITTMTDQIIGIPSSSTFVRALWEQSEQLNRLSRDTDNIGWHSNPGITFLGAIIGTALLVYVCMMSRSYTAQEREELAEAERMQIAADMEKFQKMEKYRSHISKVVESYAIHLTNTRHNASVTSPSDKMSNNIQIPEGNDTHDVPIESITISISSDDDLEDIEASRDDEGDDELISENACTNCETMRSTLTIGAAPSSSSVESTMTRSKMQEVVSCNPCPICLEPFKAGDDVVVCSNNHDGKTPHIFHQACSLDYILAHPQKIKAPCPMCRNLLVPSEEKQRNEGCFRHVHRSALTLPDLDQV